MRILLKTFKWILNFLNALKRKLKSIYQIRCLFVKVFCIISSLFFLLIFGFQLCVYFKSTGNLKSVEEENRDTIYVFLNNNKSSNLKKDFIISNDTSIITDLLNGETIHEHNTELLSLLKLKFEVSNNWRINYSETTRQSQNIFFLILAAILTLLFNNKSNKIVILKITIIMTCIMFYLDVDNQYKNYCPSIQLTKTENSINKLLNLKPTDKNWYILDDKPIKIQ